MDFHNQLPRYRALHVQFYGPTNHRGARIRIKDLRRGDSVWLSYDHAVGDIVNQAGDYLHTQGIGLSALVLHDTQDGYTLATPDFATPIKNPLT
jgi:hypothetical protein